MSRWLSRMLSVPMALWMAVLLIAAPAASAASIEAHVALHDGQLEWPLLSARLSRYLNLPEAEIVAQVDLRGLVESKVVTALDRSLGDGCDVQITRDQLSIAIDTDKLPRDVDSFKAAVRSFTALCAPQATEMQNATYGLLMPGGDSNGVDESRPMVVLVHGLDCNRRNWSSMTDLLQRDGDQVAYFTYPSDQPLADSAELLARHMIPLRQAFPRLRVDVIAHSMGGLVARDYIEGPEYAGGVEHLILIAPPNHGSKWARYRILLEAEEHYYLWRDEPNWSWTWMITDGLGEAGRDLRPDSRFLEELNARPRRAGVKYTVIAGTQHPGYRWAANCLDRTAAWIPDRISHWWGVRQCGRAIERTAERLDHHVSSSDGPVSLTSTELDGVDDIVVLHADHTTLYYGAGDSPPAAWPTIHNRLRR